MGQLHQLLAVETEVKNQSAMIHSETMAVFQKPDLFTGLVKTLVMTKAGLDEVAKASQEAAGAEARPVTTTVDERLAYDANFFVRRVDWQLSKELSNQKARGDLIVNGITIARGLPATFLLSLEDLVADKRKQYAAAPTLPSGTDWDLDSKAAKQGVYKMKTPDVTLKTEKDFQFRTLAPATDKHPAQIEKWNVDLPVGRVTTTKSLGMWTSARKADVLARCDALIQGIKEARSRANQQEAEIAAAGKNILDFIEAQQVNA